MSLVVAKKLWIEADKKTSTKLRTFHDLQLAKTSSTVLANWKKNSNGESTQAEGILLPLLDSISRYFGLVSRPPTPP